MGAKASALVTTQSNTGLWRRRRRGRGFLGGVVHAVKKHVVNPWLQCKQRLIDWSPTNRLHDKFLWGHCREKFQKKKEMAAKVAAKNKVRDYRAAAALDSRHCDRKWCSIIKHQYGIVPGSHWGRLKWEPT